MGARFQIFGVPIVGTELFLDEQRYELVGVEPYARRDGGNSFLLTWRGSCPECGADFESGTGTAGAPPRRRCPPCRLPPGEQRAVSGKRWQAVKVELRYPASPGVSGEVR